MSQEIIEPGTYFIFDEELYLAIENDRILYWQTVKHVDSGMEYGINPLDLPKIKIITKEEAMAWLL